MKTVNITLKIEEYEVRPLESWLNQQLEVISFKILPDTDELHNTSELFRKLVKNVKQATWERDTFINENN